MHATIIMVVFISMLHCHSNYKSILTLFLLYRSGMDKSGTEELSLTNLGSGLVKPSSIKFISSNIIYNC